MYTSTWSPAGGTVCGGLGDAALVEYILGDKRALRLKALCHFQFTFSASYFI